MLNLSLFEINVSKLANVVEPGGQSRHGRQVELVSVSLLPCTPCRGKLAAHCRDQRRATVVRAVIRPEREPLNSARSVSPAEELRSRLPQSGLASPTHPERGEPTAGDRKTDPSTRVRRSEHLNSVQIRPPMEKTDLLQLLSSCLPSARHCRSPV